MRQSATTLAPELAQDELSHLLDFLKKEKFKGRHLEIGTAAGGTLAQMMSCYPPGQRPQFVVVDTMEYFPNQYDLIRKNLENHGCDPGQVEFRIGKSSQAFPVAERSKEEYDFVFIDGSHRLKHVMEDLRWARLLRPGGGLVLHDYHSDRGGVRLAAERFLRKNASYQRIVLVNRLLFIRKLRSAAVREIDGWDLVFANLLSPLLRLQRSMRKRFGSGGSRERKGPAGDVAGGA